MNASVSESQRDSILQPRVAESARLPWVSRVVSSQPQRGCINRRLIRRGCNPVGVGNILDGRPRVARASQPWAELCYPFGVERAATSDSEKATLQYAVTATDQQIDQLIYELYGLNTEEIALVEGTA